MNARITVTAILLTMLPLAAAAGDIATWIDADGVTHFGNPQFAPPQARAVEVEPANGMAVPAALPVRSSSSSGGPATVVLEKKPNRKLVGWRGHEWNVRHRRHR